MCVLSWQWEAALPEKWSRVGLLMYYLLADPEQEASLPECEFLHRQDRAKEDTGLIGWL